MAYIGTSPVVGDFRKIDDISASFNSSATSFNLAVNGQAVTPGLAQSLIISVDGVIQEPGVAYTVNGSTINFTGSPSTGASFFGVLLGSVGGVGTPADNSVVASSIANYVVTSTKMSNTGVTAATYGNASIIPVITVDGAGRVTGASNVSVTIGTTITDDTSTNSTHYLPLTTETSGTITSAKVSSSKLFFNPSTGLLTSTDYNSSSDITLKDNVTDIVGALDTIKQLTGKSFTWKDSGAKGYGLIAQDVEQVIPDIVVTTEGIKGINYINIIAFLIESVKELSLQVDQLKKQ